MTAAREQLAGLVPAEFLDTLLLLMPDADAGPSAGETGYFPCYDREALDHGNRLFWAEPGAQRDLPYELEARIAPGTLRATGTWLGADPPGGIAVPERRVWVPDADAFEVVAVIRQPDDTAVAEADE